MCGDGKFEGRDYSSFIIAESATVPASAGHWLTYFVVSVFCCPSVSSSSSNQAASGPLMCADVLAELRT